MEVIELRGHWRPESYLDLTDEIPNDLVFNETPITEPPGTIAALAKWVSAKWASLQQSIRRLRETPDEDIDLSAEEPLDLETREGS